ncbi:MAG: hypothetical protein IPL81_10445 [Flavobacteriales bacterium]|nr:hypothetical protein [Flavobacteriales bacterium]
MSTLRYPLILRDRNGHQLFDARSILFIQAEDKFAPGSPARTALRPWSSTRLRIWKYGWHAARVLATCSSCARTARALRPCTMLLPCTEGAV